MLYFTPLATCPNLYLQLIGLELHNTLLQLLGHDNGDIAMCVADLLREMLDVEPLHEGTEGGDILSQLLLDGQVISLLVALLSKLDEKNREEARGVHNILGKPLIMFCLSAKRWDKLSKPNNFIYVLENVLLH